MVDSGLPRKVAASSATRQNASSTETPPRHQIAGVGQRLTKVSAAFNTSSAATNPIQRINAV